MGTSCGFPSSSPGSGSRFAGEGHLSLDFQRMENESFRKWSLKEMAV